MIQAYIKLTHWQCWPFWVLELTPDASNSDIEKSVRDLNSKIEFGFDGATQFATPLGLFDRDEYLIREAKSTLQSPEDRLSAEFWFIDPNTQFNSSEDDSMHDTSHSESDWLTMLKVT